MAESKLDAKSGNIHYPEKSPVFSRDSLSTYWTAGGCWVNPTNWLLLKCYPGDHEDSSISPQPLCVSANLTIHFPVGKVSLCTPCYGRSPTSFIPQPSLLSTSTTDPCGKEEELLVVQLCLLREHELQGRIRAFGFLKDFSISYQEIQQRIIF